MTFADVIHDVPDAVWALNPKREGRRWAKTHGVRVPRLYDIGKTPANLAHPTDRPVVLKPNEGTETFGVFPLQPIGGNKWRNAWTWKTHTWQQMAQRVDMENTHMGEMV